MKNWNENQKDLLKNWLTVDVLEAMNDAKSKIDLDFPPATLDEAMWLDRYDGYRAELIRRNAYVARSDY